MAGNRWSNASESEVRNAQMLDAFLYRSQKIAKAKWIFSYGCIFFLLTLTKVSFAGSINVSTYWPLGVGNSWVYDCVNNQGQSDSVSVTSQKGVSGQTNFVQVSAGCAGSATYEFSSAGNGILWNGMVGNVTFSPAVLFLPATANPGDTFTSSGTFTTATESGTYTGSVQVIEIQNISVPAGRFKALAVTQKITQTFQTSNGPLVSTINDQVWLGSAIGELKRVEFSYLGTQQPATPSVELDLVSASVVPSDAKDDCSSGCGQNAGDPINIRTGNSAQAQVDYRSPDGLLDLQRIYNSTSSQAHTIGVGWRHSFDRRLTFVPFATPRRAVLLRPDGKVFSFQEPSGDFGIANPWLSDPDLMSVLTPTYSGSTTPTGWVYVNQANEVEQYDTNGNLTAITKANGRSVKIVDTTALNETVVSSVTDDFGHALIFQYDSSGRVSQITDPAGKTIIYGYDSNQNLATVMFQDGSVRTYYYNEQAQTGGANLPNALTSIVDESGHKYVSWQFNAAGQATNSQLAGAIQSTTVVYTSATSSTVIDGAGTEHTIDYDAQFGVTKPASMSMPSNSAISEGDAAHTYDANGNTASRTDFNGNKSCYSFDRTRNLELIHVGTFSSSIACPSSLSSYSIPTPVAGTNITQLKVSTKWHPDWRLPIQRAMPNKITTWVYNGQMYNGGKVSCAPANALVNGKPIAVICKRIEQATSDPSGTLGFSASAVGSAREWDMTYSSTGQVLTVNGPRTDVTDLTSYVYFSCTTGAQCGKVQTITNALNQLTTFKTYNSGGFPLTLSDINALPITLTYDLRNRLMTQQIDTETTTFGYYSNGLLKNKTLPDASFLSYLYNAANLLTEIDDTLGNRSVYSLDSMGNRTGFTIYNSSGTIVRTHTRTYDALNHPFTDVNAANTAAVTTTYGYDTQGNLISVDAPLARNSSSQIDALNRRGQLNDAAGGVTHFTYDASNRLTEVQDPRSLVTSYVYDGYGELTSQSSPDTGASSKTYDSAGNVKTTTDARGAVATNTYDALNRLTQQAYTDQTIRFTYDSGTNGKGLRTGASDANHSMSWTYDTLGRVTSKVQTVASIAKSVGYSYTNGDLITLTTPSGQTVTYGYTNHRITSIKIGSTVLLSGVTYDPFGPPTAWTWGNSSTVSRVYDEDGNPHQIVTAGVTNGYTVDAASRITSITDSGLSTATWNFTNYDSLDRIKVASSSAKSRGYTYDASGNRLTTTGSSASTETIASNNNQLNTVSGGITRSYTYDAAGNTKSFTGESFTFNQRGRMSTATSSSATSYIYNALGQLIEKSGNGGTTLLMYDERGHILGEYSSTGGLIQETIWMDDLPVATIQPSGSSTAIYYVHTDHLGTPRKITNPSGNAVVWRWDPDTFGSVTPSVATITYNLRFPGQYYLPESGLHYNYYRTYDPNMGRYVESDPTGLGGGINPYAYVGGNPINYIDYQGTQLVAPISLPPLVIPGTDPNTGTPPLLIALINAGEEFYNIVGDATSAAGEIVGNGLYDLFHPISDVSTSDALESSGLPPGYWPGPAGAVEWGRRNDVNSKDAKNRFHRGVKQNCPGAKATDVFGVNPANGDVVDGEGKYVDNLGNVDTQK